MSLEAADAARGEADAASAVSMPNTRMFVLRSLKLMLVIRESMATLDWLLKKDSAPFT